MIEVGEYLCWGSGIVTLIHKIRQRSMMIWQWSICPMCSSYLLHVPLFTHSCTSATGAGIPGSFLHWLAVFTCLVRLFLQNFLCWYYYWFFLLDLLIHWTVYVIIYGEKKEKKKKKIQLGHYWVINSKLYSCWEPD